MLTRRGFSGVLAGITLAGAAGPARADLGPLEEAARKEGGLTWYTAQTDGETAELIGRSFTLRFPGVKVTVIRTTAQIAYERLSQDIKNKTPQCDVFSSTDPGHDETLKQKNLLARYVPQNDAALSEQFRNFDKDGFYHSTAAGLVLIWTATAYRGRYGELSPVSNALKSSTLERIASHSPCLPNVR